METRKNHLDLRRHFRQLLRDVLPIFLVVALLLAVVTVLFFSKRGKGGDGSPIRLSDTEDGSDDLPRISLLAAGDEQEMSESWPRRSCAVRPGLSACPSD